MHDIISEVAPDCGELLQGAIESLPHLAWLCDAKGNCFYANRRFRDYRAAVLGDKVRLNWLDLVSRNDEVSATEQWLSSAQRIGVLDLRMRLRTRSGEPRWFDVKVVPIHDPSRSLHYWFGLAYDVTAQDQLDTDSLDSQFGLEATITHTVANLTITAMAHELNQPLAAAGTYASVAMRLLRNKVTDRDTFEHALDQIIREIRRAGKMFKDYSVLEAVAKPTMQRIDLAQEVREAVSKLRGEGTPLVSITVEGELEPVLANSVWLEKCLHRLIRLRVPVESEDSGAPGDVRVSVAPSADGTHGQVTVQHSGPPLDDETIRILFKPHYSFKSGPLGLSLAVSRTLIEALGAEFWTEPNRHEGPAYCLGLPYAHSQESPEP